MSSSDTSLGGAYSDLSGDGLLSRLSADGRTDVLEAFFRYGDDELAAAVAPSIFENGDEQLVGLLAGEVLEPTLAEPFPSALLASAEAHRPTLPSSIRKRVLERLRDVSPLADPYQSGRATLERWAIEQPGGDGEGFALSVISRETSFSEEASVRSAAYRRCRKSSPLRRKACALVIDYGDAQGTPGAWDDVCIFISEAAEDRGDTPGEIVPALEWVVENVEQSHAATLPERVRARVCESSSGQLQAALGGEPLSDTPGSRALIEAVAHVNDRSVRVELFTAALEHQSTLCEPLDPHVQLWDDQDWKAQLRAIKGAPVGPTLVQGLLALAPVSLSALIVEVAISQDSATEVLRMAGQRLRERIAEIEDTAPIPTNLCAWPKRADAEGRIKLSSVLEGLEETDRAALLASAFEDGKLDANGAAELFPNSQLGETISRLEPGKRVAFIRALEEQRPDELASAIVDLQVASFSLDIAGAAAPYSPSAAFRQLATSYLEMPEAEKDRAVALLADFATEEHLGLLSEIAGDAAGKNWERRVRVAARIAEIAEPSEPLPESVIGMLDSGREEVRVAAVDAIRKVKPRDAGLFRRLHVIRSVGLEPGRHAELALDDIANDLTGALGDATSQAEAEELFPLLGACARPGVLDALYAHLGPAAPHDLPGCRRLAAESVKEACYVLGKIEPTEQARLIGLIEGDPQTAEADPEALKALGDALNIVSLGEDGALQLLYDEIGRVPKGKPGALYGDERQWIVRHLDLMHIEHKRGKPGWRAEIENRDIVAERLARAAYLIVGANPTVKSQIESNERKPDYGTILGVLAGTKLEKAQPQLAVLHDLRSNKTNAHIGSDPTDDDIASARSCFREGAKILIGILEAGARTS